MRIIPALWLIQEDGARSAARAWPPGGAAVAGGQGRSWTDPFWVEGSYLEMFT